MLSLEQLNEMSYLLANIIHSRLSNCLRLRCKPRLHDHWIWKELFSS
jgi:hypothetical protein